MHTPGARAGTARDPLWIALATGLIPFFAAHGAYLLSAADGLVPWCLPYLDGCTSISRAARHGAGSVLFKTLMLLDATLLVWFWRDAARAAARLASPRRRRRALLPLGAIGALFLVLYVVFLGVEGPTYQWLRRYGITVYFSFTVLAQIILASLLVRERGLDATTRIALTALCAAMLLLGLASIPLQHLMSDRDAAINAVEWCYALLMTSFFPVAGLCLRVRKPVATGG